MKISEYRVGFVGFGHMAKILFQAFDRAKLLPRSHILFHRRDPKKAKEVEEECKITATSLLNLVRTSDVLLICVRPNQTEFILRDLAELGIQGKKIISIVSGIKLKFYEKYLGSDVPLLRTMPNLPLSIGEGVTVFSYAGHPSLEFRSLATLLFSSAGEVIELPENLMDIACGMSGSSPAFIFKLIEAQARIGEKEGIAYAKSLKIAAQSFLGAAKMILKGEKSPDQLIHEIAVPKGTTEAGLKVIDETFLTKHFQEAILAAAQKSKEISEEYY